MSTVSLAKATDSVRSNINAHDGVLPDIRKSRDGYAGSGRIWGNALAAFNDLNGLARYFRLTCSA